MRDEPKPDRSVIETLPGCHSSDKQDVRIAILLPLVTGLLFADGFNRTEPVDRAAQLYYRTEYAAAIGVLNRATRRIVGFLESEDGWGCGGRG